MALRPADPRTNYRSNTLVTGPATEPVTAAELRAFARADATTLPDAVADPLILRCRNYLEELTGLAMINQSWRLGLDAWPGYNSQWWSGVLQMASTELLSDAGRPLEFPRYPLSSITSVSTFDSASAETVVTVATTFDIDTYSRPGRIRPKSSQTWPTATRNMNAVEIVYVAGYGSSAADVPASIRDAVLVFAGYYYEHQGECTLSDALQKSGAGELIQAYAIRKFGVGK
jgi:hypothetical protein